MITLMLPLISAEAPTLAPAGCRIIQVDDPKGEISFIAIVPNGFPVYWNGRHWGIPDPLACAIIENALSKQLTLK